MMALDAPAIPDGTSTCRIPKAGRPPLPGSTSMLTDRGRAYRRTAGPVLS